MSDMRKYMILVERVFHGTPHTGIEKFDTKFMSTGEGNQTYGWGLYFASEKKVAEYYQKGLTQKKSGRFPVWLTTENAPQLQQRLRMENISNTPAMDQAVVLLSWYVSEYKTYDVVMDFIQELPDEPLSADTGPITPENSCTKADIAKLAFELYIPANKGALYTLEIPDQSEFLLWDEIFLKQSDWVQKVLERLFLPGLMDEDYEEYREAFGKVTGQWFDLALDHNELKEEILSFLDQMTGEEFYAVLCAYVQIGEYEGNPKKKASLLLLSKRIHGIKYKDQFTRAGGAGTYNYVVFDGASTKIVDKQ